MAGVETEPHGRLTSAQLASLVSKALRSDSPEAFFRLLITILNHIGRDADAVAATYLRELHRMGEIEILMTLRAQWLGRR